MSDSVPLGFWPTINKIYHDRYRCSGQSLAALCVDGPLGAAPLAQCLFLLQNRHPLLQALITESTAGCTFTRAAWLALPPDARPATVPLQVIERRSEDHWKEVAHTEIDRDAAAGAACLWRAVALQDSAGHVREIIMLFHHSLCDGMSMTRFVHDLLELTGRAAAGQTLPRELEPLPLLGPVEAMLPPPLPAARPAARPAAEQTPWPFERWAPLQDRSTRILYWKIEADLLERIRRHCRREHTTVNSALTAALLRAAAPADGRDVACSSGLNLRPRCTPPLSGDHFGCFIMMLQTGHTLSRVQTFWDLARTCRTDIEAEIALRRAQGFLPRRFHRAFLEGTMRDNLASGNERREFIGGPVLSNLGVLDYPDTCGPLRVRDLYCVTSQLSGLYMLFLGLYSLYGRLFCSLSHTVPLLSAATADRIAADFTDELQQACPSS